MPWHRETTALYAAVLRRMRPHAGRFAIALGAVLAASAAEVLKPWPLKVVIDNVLRAQPPRNAWLRSMSATELLGAACVALVAIYAFLAIVNVINNYLNFSTGQSMVAELRAELFDHLQKLSLSFHRKREIGDLMVRLAYDTFSIQMIAMNGFFPATSSLILLLAMFAVMIRMDARLTVVSLAVVPFLFMLIALISRRIHRMSDSQMARESKLYTIAQGALSAIHVVQAFTAEPESHREFVMASDRSLGEFMNLQVVQSAYAGAVNVLVAFGTAAVVYLGARHVMEGVLSIGDLVVFTIYLASLYGPVNEIFQTYGQVRAGLAGLNRCLELLAIEPEVKDRPDARAMPRARGQIEFDSVCFGYEPERPVLGRISFRAQPGERIAIVGPSGAGKTTMASLMARFYEPQQGAIRIDGTDIREVKLESLRRNIAIVMQPPMLVGGTMRDNIAFGTSTASRQQIERAAKLAHLEQVIARLPGGIDETIVAGGHTLSEGEAQRVTIARALLRDAPILIMDEPTSALDIETETEVLAAVEEAMRGRTTLVIAHRLSTIRRADRILVLRDGVIEESGTFEQLIARDGFFNHLYKLHTWSGDEPIRKQA